MFSIDENTAKRLTSDHGSPLFVYSRNELISQADQLSSIKAPFGFKASYAMKANPHPEILDIFKRYGIGIDASSSFEAEKALNAGIEPSKITLTSQQLPADLKVLTNKGIKFNACSLNQLKTYCKVNPKSTVGVRINPGMGSGTYNRVTTGGVSASFGIWHEYITDALKITADVDVKITQLHTHIGSGTETEHWLGVIEKNLELVEQLPDVTSLNLGGGFKFNRMAPEKSADIKAIISEVSRKLQEFANKTGRELELEIEPGTWLTAGTGSLICKVIDVKDTGSNGYKFAVVDTGMNDIIRPAMYGAQHPIKIFSKNDPVELLVAGHNCESADMFTVVDGDPEILKPRLLPLPEVGDLVEIGGAGAYCAGGFRPVGYNSFPPAPEVFVD